MGHQDSQDQQVIQDLEETKGRQEVLVWQELQGQPVIQEPMDPQDLPDLQDQLVRLVLQVLMDLQVLKEHQDPLVLMVSQVREVSKVLQGLLVKQDLLVRKET